VAVMPAPYSGKCGATLLRSLPYSRGLRLTRVSPYAGVEISTGVAGHEGAALVFRHPDAPAAGVVN
jgi:hypothetical protein